MADRGNMLWFSVAVVWEMVIKSALRRPDFEVDPARLRSLLLSDGYRELPVEGRHCLELGNLPPLHRDPFDRIMVAQARADDMTFVTADALLAGYGEPVRVV